jgi:hypothetical protein
MTYGTSCVWSPPVGGSHTRLFKSPSSSLTRGTVKTLDRERPIPASPSFSPNPPPPLVSSPPLGSSTPLLNWRRDRRPRGGDAAAAAGGARPRFSPAAAGRARRRLKASTERRWGLAVRTLEAQVSLPGRRRAGYERGGGASSLFSLEILHGIGPILTSRALFCLPASSPSILVL